jgi:hypothetical protein
VSHGWKRLGAALVRGASSGAVPDLPDLPDLPNSQERGVLSKIIEDVATAIQFLLVALYQLPLDWL